MPSLLTTPPLLLSPRNGPSTAAPHPPHFVILIKLPKILIPKRLRKIHVTTIQLKPFRRGVTFPFNSVSRLPSSPTLFFHHTYFMVRIATASLFNPLTTCLTLMHFWASLLDSISGCHVCRLDIVDPLS